MLRELRDYDWEQAFGYAGESGKHAEEETNPTITFRGGKAINISREQVTRVMASREGENDGPSWLMAFVINNPPESGVEGNVLYCYLTAGCDYTGWD